MRFVTDPAEYESEWRVITNAIDVSRHVGQGVFRNVPVATFIIGQRSFYEGQLFGDLKEFCAKLHRPGFTVATIGDPDRATQNWDSYVFKVDGTESIDQFAEFARAGRCPPEFAFTEMLIYPSSLEWLAYGSFDFDIFVIGLYREELISPLEASLTRSMRCNVESVLRFIPWWTRIEVDRAEFFRRYNPRDFSIGGRDK